MFRSWLPHLGPGVELSMAHLPGREARWSEPALVGMPDVVNHLVDALDMPDARPWVFFGHSLGGLIAFELARGMRKRGLELPRHLFVSAHRAAHVPNRYPRIAQLPDRQFAKEVHARHGGIPDEVANNRELMDLMIPSLRADYQAFENYEYRVESPLPCPISALGGRADSLLAAEDLEGWREHTAAAFSLRMFDGGHFFVNDHRPLVVSAVVDVLKGRV